jgi:hypothetical protein
MSTMDYVNASLSAAKAFETLGVFATNILLQRSGLAASPNGIVSLLHV